jgi:hypothetical protein
LFRIAKQNLYDPSKKKEDWLLQCESRQEKGEQFSDLFAAKQWLPFLASYSQGGKTWNES